MWMTAVATDSERLGAEVGVAVHDPADGTLVGSFTPAGEAEVLAAVEAARAARSSWARTSPAERGAAVALAAAAVEGAADELARLTTREMGKPLGDARGGVDAGVGTLRQYAELGPLHRGRSLQGGWDAADLMVHEPRGVVAVITPWNDPVAVPCGLLGAALVTGNTVVFKPSSARRTSGSGCRADVGGASGRRAVGALRRRQHRRAAGRVQGVDVVAHVGSTAAGRAVAAAAARTGAKVLLENGGKDAMVVDAGVDPEWAAEQAAIGCFANAGQICTAVERVYCTPTWRAIPGCARAPGRWPAARRRDGPEDPARPAGRQAAAGPGARARQRGGRGRGALLCGGELPDGDGAFYPATVLDGCTDDMAVMTEETFGPVATGAVVGSFDEGLAAAAGRLVRPRGGGVDAVDGQRPARVAGAARRHRQGQRGLRGGAREVPPSHAAPAAPASATARSCWTSSRRPRSCTWGSPGGTASSGVEQAPLPRQRSGLGATARAQLGQDVGDVDADGLGADEQLPGDLAVGPALGDQDEDLALPGGQRDGRRRLRGTRAGLMPADLRSSRSSGAAPSPRAVAVAVRATSRASAGRPTARSTAASRACDRATSKGCPQVENVSTARSQAVTSSLRRPARHR
jgi:succinate-semialdehyde dehydrogenase/glutarate-semialdehyde dehydrogenase